MHRRLFLLCLTALTLTVASVAPTLAQDECRADIRGTLMRAEGSATKNVYQVAVDVSLKRSCANVDFELVVTGENRLRFHFRSVAPLGAEPAGTEQAGEELVGGAELGEQPLVSAAIESVEVATLDTIRDGPPATVSNNDYEIRSLGEDVEFEVPADRSLVYYLVPPRRARLRARRSR